MLSSRFSTFLRLGARSYASTARVRIPEPNRQPPLNFTKLFINNEWHDSSSGKTIPLINPSNGKTFGYVQQADKIDVDKAVRAAADAFQFGSPWRRMDASQRGVLLNRLADAIVENAPYLAALESLNSGIPFSRAFLHDVHGAAAALRYYAGWANKNHGKVIPMDGNYFCYTRHEPVGVCAQITPWNVPMYMCASKIAPALAMGNTVVLKPAEQTPLSSLYIGELCRQVGFPAGVVNIISGYGDAGAAMVEHPEVNKVAFTGSTSVGQRIMANAAKHVKRVTLELGGKSPNIILRDADIDAAIQYAHLAAYYNQGQSCCAGSRLFVEEPIYDQFVERSVEMARSRKLGDPFDLQVEQGPQVSDEQLQSILRYVNLGKQQGAKLCIGGERIGNEGYYMQPTVFADVKDDMTIAKEEIFGPVMSILKFNSMDEILKRANNTPYGLAAGVFTRDMDKANHLVQGLRAGVVWLNCYFAADPAAPFGGYKMSGFGREGGEYGLQHYSEVKTVVMPVFEKNS